MSQRKKLHEMIQSCSKLWSLRGLRRLKGKKVTWTQVYKLFYILSIAMKDIIQWFDKLGFTEKQSQIYLCCYQYWVLPVSTLASKCNLKRSNCYEIIGTMIVAWYLQQHSMKWVKCYSVVDPDKLISKFKKQLASFENIVPLLENIIKYDTTIPWISVYSWLRECINMYDDMLNYQWSIYSIIGSKIDNIELQNYICDVFYRHRIIKGIQQYLISSEDDESKINIEKNSTVDLYHKKRVSRGILSFECGIHLYHDDKVMINLFQNQNMTWLIIQNKFIFETLKSMFNFLWNHN